MVSSSYYNPSCFQTVVVVVDLVNVLFTNLTKEVIADDVNQRSTLALVR